MDTVKLELATITAHEDLANAVLLILANKQDVEGAMTAAEVSTALALHANKQHDWQIQVRHARDTRHLPAGCCSPASTSRNAQGQSSCLLCSTLAERRARTNPPAPQTSHRAGVLRAHWRRSVRGARLDHPQPTA
jgi:hypothetical protein